MNTTKKGIVQGCMSSEKDPGDRTWYERPKTIDYKMDSFELEIDEKDESDITTIEINASKKYQEILGIGTSLEESTIFNLSRMSPEKRQEVLEKLVHPEKGIGMSLLRLTIGAADFTSKSFYTYDDLPEGETDPELSHFSIQKDIDFHMIDVIKEVVAINPDIKFFASPWSPPGWMKEASEEFVTNNTYNLRGGKLKSEYIPHLAKYYRKFVEAYAQLGISIFALTLQNEPLLQIDYPSCYITPDQERVLAIALKKELQTAGFDTKLWIFDHNMEDALSYVNPILTDPEGYAAVDGVAFHDYAGEPRAMTEVHNLFPDKIVNLTERSWWGTWGADRIAQYFRNWSISYNAWVTMLDSSIAPHQWVGTPDPTLMIQDAKRTSPEGFYEGYWLCPEYYLIGQFSKFVRPGAIRIDSNYGSKETVTNVAFQNTDGRIVLIVINQTNTLQAFKVVCGEIQINTMLPEGTIGTYVFEC